MNKYDFECIKREHEGTVGVLLNSCTSEPRSKGVIAGETAGFQQPSSPGRTVIVDDLRRGTYREETLNTIIRYRTI